MGAGGGPGGPGSAGDVDISGGYSTPDADIGENSSGLGLIGDIGMGLSSFFGGGYGMADVNAADAADTGSGAVAGPGPGGGADNIAEQKKRAAEAATAAAAETPVDDDTGGTNDKKKPKGIPARAIPLFSPRVAIEDWWVHPAFR